MVATAGQQVAVWFMYERSTSAAATARLGNSVSTSRMASTHRFGDTTRTALTTDRRHVSSSDR